MENNLRDFYVAVMKTGQAIHYSRLEMLKSLDSYNVECFLKAVNCEMEYQGYDGSWYKRNFYHYFMITQSGEYTKYKKGHYKVACIGPEESGNREITFSNPYSSRVFSYRSTETPDRFFYYELKPMLDKFNQLDDDDEVETLCEK